VEKMIHRKEENIQYVGEHREEENISIEKRAERGE
jgi:hypothetical protein